MRDYGLHIFAIKEYINSRVAISRGKAILPTFPFIGIVSHELNELIIGHI